MRALRWHAQGDLRVDDVEEPKLTPLLDALVDVSLCGICGTDLSEYRYGPQMISTKPHPLSGATPPVTLGHEFVGRLREGQSADGTITPGARVTVDACLRCGKCAACVRGDYHRCRFGGSIGLHVDGGFAPVVAVPSTCLIAVPETVTDTQAALTEPFAVALHALDRGGHSAGDAVAVLGFGPIGSAAALVTRALGGAPVVVELDERRRTAAEQLGFTTVEAGEGVHRRVRAAVGGGGADVVVETTGVADVVPQAIECAARGGRIVLAGLPNRSAEINPRRLTLHERSLIGTLGYRHDFPRVLGLVAAGRLDPAQIVDDLVALEDAATTIEHLAANPGGPIKTLVAVG